MSLASKVAIVTGASSGIGAAITVKLATEGARVAIVGRNESRLKSVSDICCKNGVKPLTIIADVSKDDDAKKIITEETLNSFEKIEILVNNAGISGGASFIDDKSVEVFDKMLATNLRAPFYLTHLAAKHLIETKGNIVNISSILGLSTYPNYLAYCTSKAALDHYSRCAALELAAYGVRVNTVNPGPVKTNILASSGMPKEVQDRLWESMKKGTALKRISEPEEIADLVAFLVSDKARGITGSTVVSDNGLNVIA